MRAWHFTATHEPLVMVDKPDPVPGAGEVLLDVRAAGLCHSDVGMLEDPKWMAQIPSVPVVPGHEIAGVVAAVGAGVTGFAPGDRVVVNPMTSGSGFRRDGGFAERAISPAASLIRIPDALSFPLAAIATDAGMTSHGAVIGSGRVKAGDKVGIIGFGGLGQIGTRVAVLAGAEVYVAEINETVWPLAQAAGAVRVARDISEFADCALDVIVDFAGFGTTTAAALETVRRGGRVVLVGMGRLETTINTYPLIVGRRELVGNAGGDENDIESVMRLMAAGQVTPAIEEIRFEQIGDGIDRLQRGVVRGRLVTVF